jgi:hypothetical protein
MNYRFKALSRVNAAEFLSDSFEITMTNTKKHGHPQRIARLTILKNISQTHPLHKKMKTNFKKIKNSD